MRYRKSNNISTWFLGCFMVLNLAVGCKTTSTPAIPTSITKSDEAFFSSVIDHSFRFRTLSARIKIELVSPSKELSSRAQLKIINSERMQISIQPLLGIEMFRLELTNDSIRIIDRMNKCFVKEGIENIKGEAIIDFNFQNLQALFTNNIFIPGKGIISPNQKSHFRMTKTDNEVRMTLKDKNGLNYTFVADGDEKLRSTTIEDPSDKNMLHWKYENFKTIDNQIFPFKMEGTYSKAKQKKGSVSLSFSDAEINNTISLTFNIPSGYKRVEFSQIIKSLQKI